ncbi:MAG: glycosyl hydrolase family 32, partial [Phycisphaeraceae bacterium]
MTETLYNGIELPDAWPPRDMDPAAYEPMPVPYLDDPPAVIPIDVGRQLFVDDFLIERTTLERVFHLPTKHEGNPILKPETPLETEGYLPCATPKDGGVWWDPDAGLFKMWYEAGWLGRLAYATSEDGMHWDRPALDLEPPTNRIVPELTGDSGAVVIYLDTDDPSQRYKLYERESNKAAGGKGAPGYSMVSPDGIHWSEPVAGGPVGDRSTMFYNPFRRRWVYSIRGGGQGIGRARRYREHADFLEGATWADGEAVFWCGADRNDPPDPDIGDPAQLYNLNAVGYESLMLGLFEIHLGPDNKVCQAEARPKITELKTAFSRDGFHWHRPDRRAFIPAARREGVWDRGYVNRSAASARCAAMSCGSTTPASWA